MFCAGTVGMSRLGSDGSVNSNEATALGVEKVPVVDLYNPIRRRCNHTNHRHKGVLTIDIEEDSGGLPGQSGSSSINDRLHATALSASAPPATDDPIVHAGLGDLLDGPVGKAADSEE